MLIEVVGLGLESEISPSVCHLVKSASYLIGSARHLERFPDFLGEKLVLGDLHQVLQFLQAQWQASSQESIVVLTSGDPLFYGLGRLLLEHLPKESLRFHPHVSSVQLAFSRLKIPWQDAVVVSAHGRSLDNLELVLRQGKPHIAVLTDFVNTAKAIANFIQNLELPTRYRIWVCENLGSVEEKVFELTSELEIEFAGLNVVVLEKQADFDISLSNLPLIGIPDSAFYSFPDQPGLMTKREIRVLSIGELELQSQQIIWDIGAGTGSVSIEIARLIPDGQVFAIEKNITGTTLIQRNTQRFQVENVRVITGNAPQALQDLPIPNRVFIGGSSSKLTEILELCCDRLKSNQGILVGNFASPEHLHTAMTWLREHNYPVQLLQVNLSRSVPIGDVSRFSPLNPVTILKVQF